MSTEPTPSGPEADDRPMGATYTRVVVIEVIVLLGLWAFQVYFGR